MTEPLRADDPIVIKFVEFLEQFDRRMESYRRPIERNPQILRLNARVDELLAANNEFEERARSAESAERRGKELLDAHRAAFLDMKAAIERADKAEKLLASAVEIMARNIYSAWSDQSGYVAWVPWGNSNKQQEARREALKLIEGE